MKDYYVRHSTPKDCVICGIKYIGKGSSKYCSNNCRGTGQIAVKNRYRKSVSSNRDVDVRCKLCDIIFKGRVHYKYCSKKCRNRAKQMVNNKKRIDKTGKSCEFCGFADTRAIHAHHINRADGLGVMFLCANHHYVFHAIMGRRLKSENRSKEEVLEILNKNVAS